MHTTPELAGKSRRPSIAFSQTTPRERDTPMAREIYEEWIEVSYATGTTASFTMPVSTDLRRKTMQAQHDCHASNLS